MQIVAQLSEVCGVFARADVPRGDRHGQERLVRASVDLLLRQRLRLLNVQFYSRFLGQEQKSR